MEEKYLNKDLPQFLNPKYNLDFFEKMIQNRMKELGVDKDPKYIERVKEEYNVIVGADLENYFLIIWSILHWCHKNGYLTGLARGSAAGSMIMYLLQITGINPFDYNLLFSRFLNAGRVAQVYLSFEFEDGFERECSDYTDISRLSIPKGESKIAAKFFKGDSINGHIIRNVSKEYKGHVSLPDVDMDLEDREAVKQFIIKHYGEHQFSTLGSYNNYKIKAAIKDLNRIIGSSFNYAAVNILTSELFFKENKDAKFEELFRTALNNSMLYDYIQENPKIVNALYWLLDTPKSASQHPCGTISIPDIEDIYTEYPCIYQDEDVPMCEFTGPELDSLGYVKNDLLGLTQLSFFKNIIELVKEHQHKDINIWKFPLNDRKTYEYLSKGWNSEVFQFNSFLLINYCKVANPKNITDLAVAVSIVRPGPMNSGLDKKYLKRRDGKEKITYHFGYEKFTKDTYGILIWQEQLINLGAYLGNLTSVEADGLRKCYTKNNYFYVDNKLFNIKELCGSQKKTLSLDLQIGTIDKEALVAEFFKQNVQKECLRLFSTKGTLEVSTDQKVYTLDGFKKAEDISSKDWGIFYSNSELKNVNKEKITQENNYKFYLLASLLCDANFISRGRKYIRINESNYEKVKKIKEAYSYFSVKYGYDTYIYEHYNNREKENRLNNWSLQLGKSNNAILKFLGLDWVLSEKKEIPDYLLKESNENIIMFLLYLWEFDGSTRISKGNSQIRADYNTVSFGIFYKIQLLLNKIGVDYYSYKYPNKKYYNVSLTQKGMITLYNYAKILQINCKIVKYSKLLENLNPNCSRKIPAYFLHRIIDKYRIKEENVFERKGQTYKNFEENISEYLVEDSLSEEGQISLKTVSPIFKLFFENKNIEFIQFKSREFIGLQEVYDYSMDNTKKPYAFVNNILSSNCLGKKKYDLMMSYHDKIKPKALEKGCSEKEFEDMWSEWIEFSKYSFNKSHAVAYAITGYVSQYLKVYYPNEFWTAAFQKANDSQDRKERFNQYFQELKDSNSPLKVVPPNINVATNKTTYEGNNIYFPLNNIKYLSDDSVNLIIENKKEQGDFYSFEEFLTRVSPNKELNKRELENLVLAGTFDKIENIQHPIERKRLIQILYKYLKKDYNREFFVDNFQEDELWWDLKQLNLIGIDNIDFNKISNRYFSRFMFFTKYPSLKVKQEVTFGGIISEYIERKSKKENEYFGICTILCNNIPYTLCLWAEEWKKYKEQVIKYKDQIIICECEVTENKQNNTLQFSLIKGTVPKFLGSTEETKRELPKAISFKKGDTIKTDTGIIGKIIRNASNSDIHVVTKEGKDFKITKWDIIEILK